MPLYIKYFPIASAKSFAFRSAGDDTWRAYADEALAQVAALEREAEERRISAQELLARQAALEEAAARRGKSE